MADDAQVTKLLDAIAQQSEDYKKGTPGAREALISSAVKLRPALSTPTENILFLTWADMAHLTSLRTAQEFNLFEALVSGGSTPQTSAQIAEKCEPKAEVALVGRLLRCMASHGSVLESQADHFLATAFSHAMCRQAFKDSLWFMLDYFMPICTSTAPFIAENGYAAPTNNSHTPFHKALNAPPGPIWDHWGKHTPEIAPRFANLMQVYGEGRPIWFADGYYPVRERLITGAEKNPDSVFIVDVGGGGGQDATRLLETFGSELPGKLIVQDRPEVIEITKKQAPEAIVKMPHNFFEEEPVKGARAYYFHSIIHDWPDDLAQKILLSIVPAMKPGYSKILICDCVVEDKDAHWLLTGLDIMMMTALAARERTRTEFQTLAESCGLKLIGTWKHPLSVDSIVELELA